MIIPFIEYYMLSPDPYIKIFNSGRNQICLELDDTNVKKFLPKITKEDYDSYVHNNQIFNEMIDLVRDAFHKWYNFECANVFVNNNYQENFNSYVYIDKVNPVFIHVDQLLESIILSFMLTTLKWAKELENAANENDYFIYLLFLMNEVCIFGQLPSKDAKAVIMEKIYKDQQIMNLASDCHWAIMVFTVAHEFAHIYQMYINPDYWKNHPKEMEFNADAIAYDVLLKLIMDNQEKNLRIEEYVYLAPMMYMDFFNLYYYTDYILYGVECNSQTHPTPNERKNKLFNMVEQEIYQFDTEEGNAVYQYFCLVYDLFIKKLPEYKENGRLNKVIHTELRKAK